MCICEGSKYSTVIVVVNAVIIVVIQVSRIYSRNPFNIHIVIPRLYKVIKQRFLAASYTRSEVRSADESIEIEIEIEIKGCVRQ